MCAGGGGGLRPSVKFCLTQKPNLIFFLGPDGGGGHGGVSDILTKSTNLEKKNNFFFFRGGGGGGAEEGVLRGISEVLTKNPAGPRSAIGRGPDS